MMTAILNEIVFNSTISKGSFITITGNCTCVVKSNLHTSRLHVIVFFSTIVYTELFLNSSSKIKTRCSYNVITNSTPTETFNVDNNGKFNRFGIWISYIMLTKSTSRIFRKSRSIKRTHNTSSIICTCLICVIMSTNSTRTLSENYFISSTSSIPSNRERIS